MVTKLQEKKKISPSKKENKLDKRKLEAEWIIAQSILGDLIINDFSRESYDSKKDTGLLRGKISWETWKRYFTENQEKVISRLETSTEYKDVDGVIYDMPGMEKEKILKDTQGRSASNLCKDVANLLKEKNILFFRPNSRQIVEIGNIKLQSTGEDIGSGFLEMNDKRFVTLIEKYADVGYWKKGRYGENFEIDSLSAGKTSIILNSYILEESLPQIQRIFSCPFPTFLNDELTFPKRGYDKRFNSWMNYDCIEFSEPEMSLKEAKEIIDKIYSEFCFATEQDKINAISSLITPFLRGLFPKFNTITPAFFYLGNREGVGKDYCAKIPSLVIDGQAQEDTPISDGGKINEDELRKKITTAIKYGRKGLHFANNKGYLNSAILEKLITDPMWTDRVLGKSKEIIYPNELNISLSGNIPIRYSDDLERRTIFINLFYSQEDINARRFKKSDLHEWIVKNRSLILSALFSLVKNWIKKGKPKSSVAFASFNNWSELCGGVMESGGYGNPCIRDISNKILTGDSDSDEIKELFKICYEKYPNKPIKKATIIFLIKQQDGLFSYFDFDKRQDQTRFSIKLRKYLGREFNNIIMNIANLKEKRTARQEFIFKKVGNVGNVGNLFTYPVRETNNYIQQGNTLPNVAKVTKSTNSITKFKVLKDTKFMILKNNKSVELNLEQGKVYSQEDLGDDSKKSLLILEMDKIIEVIKNEN